MKTIIINGYSGCGKDTLARNIGGQMRVASWSIADWARHYVLDAIGGTDASAKASEFADDYRRSLIHLTNIAKRKEAIWEDLEKVHQRAKESGTDLFFVHCRGTKDFINIKKRTNNTISLWVARDGILPSNEQDAEARNYNYDIEITLENLKSQEYSNQVYNLIDILIRTEGNNGD